VTIPQQIHAGEVPGVIIASDQHHLAFLDHEPVSPGHVLVCPVRQVVSIFELSDDERLAFLNFAEGVEDILRAGLEPAGVTQIMNDGPFNDLDHLHLHLIPRYENDGFEWIAKNWQKQSIEELQAVAAKLERDAN